MQPLDWHDRTKHHPHRYARSRGYLDWATQPEPFRSHAGAELLPLPLPAGDVTPPYDSIYAASMLPAQPLSLASLSTLLYHSMALSAWKQAGGARWALRVNPSSGNLHPTEAYLLCDAPELGGAGVFHHAPQPHALERRSVIADFAQLGLPDGAFLLGLSSIHWREAWKYGERAWRYCQHDIGHALAALRLAAGLCGWRALLLANVADADAASLLGLAGGQDPEEREVADLLLLLLPADVPFDARSFRFDPGAVAAIAAGPWLGQANRLSPAHDAWPVIDEIHETCTKGADWQDRAPPPPPCLPSPTLKTTPLSAGQIIRQRRSAQAMDGRSALPLSRFYTLLARTLPQQTLAPWDVLPWAPQVDLLLFVHRVTGLEPGLYLLLRDPDHLAELQSLCDPGFAWQRPADCPLPLYLLERGDVRAVAQGLSCGQDIASEGAFAVGMLARCETVLRDFGAPHYRHLFWETGAIGQVLYLEAEAAGLRGTGIGCFFDDAVHQLLGLRGHAYQSLYHFTVGGALEDARISTLPAYAPR